jgi:outer membrane protein assembly factor BamA
VSKGASPLLYNSRVSRRCISLFFVLFCCALASAQTAGKARLSYKLLSVHVKGLNHYKEDQVVQAAGLHLGQMTAEDDFKHAVEKLGETGVFNDVAYSYQYSTAGCSLEFQVTENDKLAPIVFDNFVWFSDEELFSLLRTRLPLFEDRLPLGGNLSDQVADALNAILREKQITGEAEYIRSAEMNGPVDTYVYKVNLHPVIVRNLAFPGAAAAELPALDAAAKPLSGKDYLRTGMRPQEHYNFLPVYLSRGYLKASFADAQAKVASDGPQTLVDVSFPVTPGIQYKLTGIEWAGNAVFPSDQLQKLVQLKVGEPANAVQLGSDIEAVQKLYATKGYLAAEVRPDAAMDDSQATVRYTLRVNEGDLYRMGELQIDGLADDAAKRMITQWQMKKGDPFDDSYLKRFFASMYRDVTLSKSFNVVPKQSVNQQDKTVSVFLHFIPKQ